MSPLLAGLYTDTLTPNEQKELRSNAATVLANEAIAEKKVDPYELGGMLANGLLGENGEVLFFVADALRKRGHVAGIAEHIDWFAIISVGEVRGPLFAGNPILSLLLRDIQFDIAVETGKSVLDVLDAWEAEIDALEADGYPVGGLRATLAAKALTSIHVPIPMEWLVRVASQILELPALESDSKGHDFTVGGPGQADTADLGATLRSMNELGRRGLRDVFTPRSIVDVLTLRAKTVGEVLDVMQLGVGSPPPMGTEFATELSDDAGITESLLSRTWTSASDDETTDWYAYLDDLDKATEFAEEHGFHALEVSAEQLRAIVLYENIGDRVASEESLDRATERLGYEPRLEQYRGKIFRMEEEYGRALDHYESLFDHWEEDDPNTSRTYAFHDVIVAAGALGDWERAAHWAGEGRQAARGLTKISDSYVESCYAVDEAFSLYKAGRVCDALARLHATVGALPDPKEPRPRMLHRRLSHVAYWIYGEVGGGRGSLPEPPPGLASRFDADPDEEAATEVVDAATLRVLLREATTLAGCNPSQGEPSQGDNTTDAKAATVGSYFRTRAAVERAIRDHDGNLVSVFENASEVARRTVAQKEGRDYVAQPVEIEAILLVLAFGAISAFAAEDPDQSVVEKWRSDTEGYDVSGDGVDEWFRTLDSAFAFVKGSRSEAVGLTSVLFDSSAASHLKLVAMAALARASQDEDVRHVSLALLASTASDYPFGIGVGGALASLARQDVPPGEGVRAAASVVLNYERLPKLRLAQPLVEKLHAIVDSGPTWGLGR